MDLASRTERLLGTQVEIQLDGRHSALLPSCFSILSDFERSYSRFMDESELSRANRRLGVWQPASGEFIGLLRMALEFNRRSEGYFDVTVKSALDRLGYDKDYSFSPKPAPSLSLASLSAALLSAVELDGARGRILLRKEVDFGGFGKGHAVDRVAAHLRAQGVSHYCINAGGDIYAQRGDGMDPWPILLEHPDDPQQAIGRVDLDGAAIAGSAPNRRKWGAGAHHLINPKTGRPASGASAIFVRSRSAAEADAYATAIFTAGFERGIELSRRLPVEILFVSSQKKMYQTPGFAVELFG